LVCLSCSGKTSSNTKNGADQRRFTLFVTTELKGTIEPCGCNSDPLGDLARTAEMISTSRQGKSSVLYMDGGSMLYTKTKLPPELEAQEALKADLLVNAFATHLEASAVGLGPFDLATGLANVRPARQVANLKAGSELPVEAPKIIDAGGVKIGVFGLVAPEAVSSFGLEATSPAESAVTTIADLKKRGAEVVVALAHMTRADAKKLAKDAPGIDLMLIGQNAPEPDGVNSEPDKVGDTWLFRPANRGQVVSRIDVTVRGGGGLSDAIGEERAKVEVVQLGEQIKALEADLAKWANDTSADPAFVASKKKELGELTARKASLEKTPIVIPAKGSWFVLTQVRIAKALPCNKKVQDEKLAYDKESAAANVKAAAGKKPPAPAKGEASYVGTEECAMCHSTAVDFWTKTKHHDAWVTLEKLGKEFNLDCTYCHATGWDKPGGSNLAFNENLRDVQCETCHGPGSLHIEADGKDLPRTIIATPQETQCIKCHNSEHSDTFDFEPYLRDVTGPGHGAVFREKLGEGTTGAELRSAALEKAGKAIGKGCPK
jgi:hypothetical protein